MREEAGGDEGECSWESGSEPDDQQAEVEEDEDDFLVKKKEARDLTQI